MLDVLTAITKVSVLFQNKDLLLFEVKEATGTLYMNLHVMTNEPGEHLFKFYSLLYPRHLCRGVYSFRLDICPFVCSLVCSFVCSFVTFRHVRRIYLKVFG